MDINDVIIIKFIVTLLPWVLAQYVNGYGEAIAHAHCNLKPLPLSNCYHVEYFNLALSLSLNSWLL